MRRARLLLSALILAGCGAELPAAAPAPTPAPAAGWTTLRDAEHGLTVSVPSAWHRAARSLTPALTDPREVLTLATFPLRDGPHRRCAKVPEQAVRDVGARDVLVSLQERRDPGTEFTPGPPALGPAEPGDGALCAGRPGDLEEHWSAFELGGRGFYLYAGLGRDVPAERRAELDEVLASLRVEPLVRRGRLAVLPPEGWAVVDAPLTGFEELAVASFAVPAGPPDANCTPRRAVEAMPADASPARRAELERAFDSLVVRE